MGFPLLHRNDLCPDQPYSAGHVFIPLSRFYLRPSPLAVHQAHDKTPAQILTLECTSFHFIPFLVFFAVSVIFREEPVLDDLSGFLVIDRFIPLRIVYGICFFLSVTVYSGLSFLEIRDHQKPNNKNRRNNEMEHIT